MAAIWVSNKGSGKHAALQIENFDILAGGVQHLDDVRPPEQVVERRQIQARRQRIDDRLDAVRPRAPPPGSGRAWDNRSGRAGIRYPAPDRARRKARRSARPAPHWTPRSAWHGDSGFGSPKVCYLMRRLGPLCGPRTPPRRNNAFRLRFADPGSYASRPDRDRRRSPGGLTLTGAPPFSASVITRPVSLPLAGRSRPMICARVGAISALEIGAGSAKPALKSGPMRRHEVAGLGPAEAAMAALAGGQRRVIDPDRALQLVGAAAREAAEIDIDGRLRASAAEPIRLIALIGSAPGNLAQSSRH